MSSLEAVSENTNNIAKHEAVGIFKIIGAILLIVGTSIGGGMLALPVATAKLGFAPASLYLFLTWLMMTLGALFILEVNLWLPPNSNLISMAGATIGKVGQVVAWISYLVLLYCLLAAYMAGGKDVVTTVASLAHIHLTSLAATLIFLVLFSVIVARGVTSVDWANRFIMAVKILAYVAMILLAVPYVQTVHFAQGATHYKLWMSTLMVMITSYGFAIIVPSLRTYFNNDAKKLRRVVMIGSLIPLLCYLIWEAIIFGTLPMQGAHGLLALTHSSAPVADLMGMLSHIAQQPGVVMTANIFTSVCVITAFLGVSLCLTDFLADGFNIKKTGKAGVLIYLLTFVPPFLLVTFAKRVFMLGIGWAGVCCVVLLMLLPAWMVWAGRYRKSLQGDFRVMGGKFSLLVLMLLSVVIIILNVYLKI